MKLIPLTRGEFAMVDDEDFERVSKLRWHCSTEHNGSKYAQHTIRHKDGGYEQVQMHQFVLGVNSRVDHRNGIGLDNQKSNLRQSTQAQNSRNRKIPITNTSGFKGVYFRKDRVKNPWSASIGFEGVKIKLGCFNTPVNAAIAYDAAAIRLHGEFARTNKMEGRL